MKQLNLNGEWEDVKDIAEREAPVRGHFKVWRSKNNYRRGNFEECCKSCINFRRVCHHHTAYLKCNLQGISRSTSSDIRASYVCNQYESAGKIGR